MGIGKLKKVRGWLRDALIVTLLFCKPANAQQCDSNFFALRFTGHVNTLFTTACINDQNELLAVSTQPYHNSWLTKFTSQGNVIWSNEYTGDYEAFGWFFSNLQFESVVVGPDSSYFVSGTTHANAAPLAILANIDKYGKVRWSKIYITLGEFPRIMLTRSGKLIVYAQDNGNPKIMSLAVNGSIEWVTVLKDKFFKYMPGMKPAITQLMNGNIAIADALHNTTVGSEENDFHFFALDPDNGSIQWESSFEFPGTDFTPQFTRLTELPNGNLSLLSSLNIKTALSPVISLKTIDFLLSSAGNHIGTIAYYVSNDPASAADVALANDGSRVILENLNGKAALVNLGPDSEIKWFKGYANAPGSFAPAALSKAKTGYDMLMNAEDSKSAQLLFTDPAGRLDCAASDVAFIKEAVPWSYKAYSVQSAVSGNDNELLSARSYALTTSTYMLDKTTDCQYLGDCCVDVIDSVREITLCEGNTYQFPDKTAADSGLYYISRQSEKGCDSVQLFHIQLLKNPADLRASLDTCFDNKDSLTLHATEGFPQYNWTDQLSRQSSITIYQEGNYFVTVSNACGSKTDTIHVYKKCDYEIYMPNAFTPNKDGKNELFRIPLQNKNRLLEFSIFNRWGQRVFYTRDISKGWDGKFNNETQPVGTYIYYIEMNGLNGNRLKQRGNFLLLR